MGTHVLFVLFSWVASVGQAEAMEPNAFLNHSASTNAQLVSQVKNNPVVADRYVRHFALSKNEIADYFSALRRSTLPHAGQWLVYNCRPDGRLRVRLLTLRAGTAVWVDPRGIPVLKASCGNPMIWQVEFKPQPVIVEDLAPPTAEFEMDIVEENLFPTSIEEMVNAAILTPEDAVGLVPEMPEVTIGEIPEVVTKSQIPLMAVGGGFPWGILGLVGILPVFEGGDGPPPIPEPSMFAVVGAGLALVGLRRRRIK